MGRGLTNLITLVLAQAASGQGFGRFGYTDLPQIPGIVLDANGFRANVGSADTFKFAKSIRLHRTKTTPEEAWYSCGSYAGNPQKVKVNLRSPGFELYCPLGLDLRLSSLTGPLLTVGEASYGPGTPAQTAKWVLVTFSDPQPSILIVFQGTPVGTMVTGRNGEWRFQTLAPYSGWIRVCLPFGTKPISANSVGTLGKLSKDVAHRAFFWSQPSPSLKSISTVSDDSSVSVLWTFDSPGALVPPAFSLAQRGGYAVTSDSTIGDLGISTDEGPTLFTRGKTLRIKFPMKRIGLGRALGVGQPAMGTIPASTQPSLTSTMYVALANIASNRTENWAQWARASIDEYFARLIFNVEPRSTIELPYSADGEGMELAAANSLLMQSLNRAQSKMPVPNSLMTSLLWRMDPMTWRIVTPNPDVSRRTSALTSLTAWFDLDDRNRAAGAMLQAGLVSETALPGFCAEKGMETPVVSSVDPLAGFRSVAFGGSKSEQFFDFVSSPLRLLTAQSVFVSETKTGFELHWEQKKNDSRSMVLMAPGRLVVSKGQNIVSLGSKELLGTLIVQFVPKSAGHCSLFLKRSGPVSHLPIAVPPPNFSD